jgi:hypothetical protein
MDERLRLRDRNLEWRAVEGEVVALDVEASQYLAINATGRGLWEALASGATRAELADLLATEHGVHRASAVRDAEAFLAALERRGLLERAV